MQYIKNVSIFFIKCVWTFLTFQSILKVRLLKRKILSNLACVCVCVGGGGCWSNCEIALAKL